MSENICYTDAYARSIPARVRGIETGDSTLVVLDRTVFYPGGGGQPPDRGLLLPAVEAERLTKVIPGSRAVASPDSNHYTILQSPSFAAALLEWLTAA